jgi:hypothetical protein
MDYNPMSGLKPGAFQPVSAQPNPWLYFAIRKITDGFNFQAAPSDWFLHISH